MLRRADQEDATEIRGLKGDARRIRAEISQLREAQIVGESPAMLKVLREISQVATTNATVLIRGETGTGKELVARTIHAASQRGEGPLVCVNCAAIPTGFIESEFFGHLKGSFTGATHDSEGLFRPGLPILGDLSHSSESPGHHQ